MQPTTTIRTSDPRELLALIPYQLGFAPDESAIVVSLRGPRNRVGLIARVDLGDLTDTEGGPQVARSLVTHLVDDRASSTVLVLYTAQDLQQPYQRASGLRALSHLQAAASYFLGEVPCWVVGSDGYYGVDCEDEGCCPPGGRPLTALQSTQVGAHMVLSGAQVAASRAELALIRPAPPGARRSARRAAERWEARRVGGADLVTTHAWRRDGLSLWRAELSRATKEHRAAGEGVAVGQGADRGPHCWQPPASTALGRLQAALDDVLVRDAVMLSFVDGAERVADRVLVGDGGDEVGRVLGSIVDPAEGIEPRPERIAGARAVLEQVLAHSPKRLHAPGATLLAVLAWWEGDGAQAGILVDRALGADPGYRLAALMNDTLAAGMPPGWLRGGRT